MNKYFRIPVWETKKRIRTLNQFYTDVDDFFRSERGTAQSEDARRCINLSMQKALRTIHQAGINTEMTWTPAPIVGGYVQQIDVVLNVFELDRFQIHPRVPIGFIEQAIGVYSDDLTNSWRRTLNPFWWVGRGLAWIARLPFLLLQMAGFDARRAKASLLGKFTSLILQLIPLVAAALAILEFFNLRETVQRFFSS